MLITFCRDFNAPLVPPRPADSSAAMIAANGLILLSEGELSLQPPNTTGANYYTNAAIEVSALQPLTLAFYLTVDHMSINVLTVPRPLSLLQLIANMTALAWRPSWQSLLANGTVNNPQLNNLTGIVYGACSCYV